MIPTSNNIFGKELRQGLVKEFSYQKGGLAESQDTWCGGVLAGGAYTDINGVHLNGVDSEVTSDDPDYDIIGASDFTLRLKFKLNVYTGDTDLLQKGASGSHGRVGIQIVQKNTYIQLVMKDVNGTYFYRDVAISPVVDIWRDLYIVFDFTNEEISYYLDGTYVSTQNLTGIASFNNTEQMRLGRTSYSHLMDGAFNTVQIYDRALTQQEIENGDSLTDYIREFSYACDQYFQNTSWNGATLENGAFVDQRGLVCKGDTVSGAIYYDACFAGKSAATIDTIVKFKSFVANNPVVSQRDGLNGFEIAQHTGNTLYVTLGNGTTNVSLYATDMVLDVDTWYRITATYDGSTIKLYVNGVQSTITASQTGSIGTTQSKLGLGCDNDLAVGCDVIFKEVNLYDKALTDQEITSGTDTGLIKSFELSSTTKLSNNWCGGLLKGGAHVDNAGLHLNGVGSYVESDVGTALDNLTSFTIVCFAQKGTKDLKLVNKLAPANGIVLKEQGGNLQFFTRNASGVQAGGNFGYNPTSNLTQYVAVYDGNKMMVYVNGVKLATEYSQSGSIGSNTNNLIIGAEGDTTYPMDGTIQYVKIFNRALPANLIW